VSESGGATIDRIDIADTGSNSILLENRHNVNIAAESGAVTRGGDIRLAARTHFANPSDITIQNLTITNTAVNESPRAINSTFRNLTLVNARDDTCDWPPSRPGLGRRSRFVCRYGTIPFGVVHEAGL
jgi:hypothetical protein